MKYKSMLPILAALFIGIGVVFASELSKHQDPIVSVAYSQLVSAALIFLLIKIKGIKTDWTALFKNFKKELVQLVFATSVGLVLVFLGLSLTNTIKALFLQKLEVVFVLIIGFLLNREKINLRQLFFILILMFGAFLLTTSGDLSGFKSYIVGDLLLILSVVFFAYSYFPIKKIVEKIDPIFLNFISSFFVGMVILLVVLVSKPVASLAFSLSGIYLLLGYVLFIVAIGDVLWKTSIKYNKPWVVSSLSLSQPIFGGILAFLWLGYTLSQIQLVGAALIVLASLFIIRENS